MAKKRPEKKTKRRKSIPRIGTRSAKQYFEVMGEINRFFNFILKLVSTVDSVQKTASKALIDTAKSEEESNRLKKAANRPGPLDELKRQRQVVLEIVLVRHVENFLNYLSGLLFEVFTQRPETLRSSDKIEVARVLQHGSIDEFVQELARRKVDSLSYSSLADLAQFFDDRFGLSVIDSSLEHVLVEAIETRNISVHNRCMINERYISRTSCDAKKNGQRRELFISDLDLLVPTLVECVTDLDKAARKKLKLKGIRFSNSGKSPH